MSDRELLEAAAKAAGIELQRSRLNDPLFHDMLLKVRDPAHNGRGVGWNPLIDDGDALRLAVKLNMRVSVGQVDWLGSEYVGEFSTPESVESDPYAATRRAIVRAAAAMAKEPK